MSKVYISKSGENPCHRRSRRALMSLYEGETSQRQPIRNPETKFIIERHYGIDNTNTCF